MNVRKKARPTSAEIQVTGRKIPIDIRWVDGGRKISVVTSFGVIDVSIGTRLEFDHALKLTGQILEKSYRKSLDSMSFERMLDWSNKRIWILGRKLRISLDDPEGFNAPLEASSFTRTYDRTFKKYLRSEILKEASRGNISLPEDFKIRLSKFRTMLASYNLRTRTFAFDRRLFAYRPTVIRSVIDHELSHVHHPNHGKDFKEQLYSLMDQRIYRACKGIITRGEFSRDPHEEQ